MKIGPYLLRERHGEKASSHRMTAVPYHAKGGPLHDLPLHLHACRENSALWGNALRANKKRLFDWTQKGVI